MVLTKSAFSKSIAVSSRGLLLSCAVIGGAALLDGAPARAGVLNDVMSPNNGSDAASGAQPDGSPQPQRGLLNQFWNPGGGAPSSATPPAQPAPAAAPGAPAAAPVAPAAASVAPAVAPGVTVAPGAAPASRAVSVPAAPPEQPGFFSSVMSKVGLGGAPAGPIDPHPQFLEPLPASGPTAAPAAPAQPGMFDKVLGAVGIGTKKEIDNIDYSERPKLAVPQQRDLPPPREAGGPRMVAPPPNAEALTRPPAEYLEKVPGPDGHISGLKEGDIAKEKKFLGFF